MRIGRRRLMPASNLLIRNEALVWKSELNYLGTSFLSTDKIKYNLQTPRQKYYGALNGIFGKIGTNSSISVILSLINAFCVPVLTFATDVMNLTNSNYNSLETAYTSAFTKIFSTFDKLAIRNCLFYCGFLPMTYVIDLRKIKFLTKLERCNNYSMLFLFKRCGDKERLKLFNQYKILSNDTQICWSNKMGLTLRIRLFCNFVFCAVLFVYFFAYRLFNFHFVRFR